MIKVLEVLVCGGIGGFVGFYAGLFACPDPGDLGMGTMPWAVGGAMVGAVIGVGASVAVLT